HEGNGSTAGDGRPGRRPGARPGPGSGGQGTGVAARYGDARSANREEDWMTTTMNPAAGKAAIEHQVADLKLAEWGRKEILLAEQEMPGLMAVRKEYAATQPLKG